MKTYSPLSKTRPYIIWKNMKARCCYKKNASYKDYGAKGISYDKKWDTFDNFWKDMQCGYSDKLTLDRIDNGKGYFKKNCRWATPLAQANNKTNNKRFNFKGNMLTIPEIARKMKVRSSLFWDRINAGWPLIDVFKTPVTKHGVYSTKKTKEARRELIKKLFEVDRLSQKQIAVKLGYSQSGISRMLK